jgi:hypothetical protein
MWQYTEILDVPHLHYRLYMAPQLDAYRSRVSAATAKPKKLVLKYAMELAMGYIARAEIDPAS